jgi:hypothetical protein
MGLGGLAVGPGGGTGRGLDGVVDEVEGHGIRREVAHAASLPETVAQVADTLAGLLRGEALEVEGDEAVGHLWPAIVKTGCYPTSTSTRA